MNLPSSCVAVILAAVLAGCSSGSNSSPSDAVVVAPLNTPTPTPVSGSNDEPNPTEPPAAPTGVTGVVYNEFELELFWDRSMDPEVIRYAVSRNGDELTDLDGLSFYDNTVEPATTYEYKIQTITDDGTRSLPVSQFLTTPEATSALNSVTAMTVLAEVIAAINGSLFTEELLHPIEMSQLILRDEVGSTGFIEIGSDVSSQASLFKTFDCEFGGEFDTLLTSSAMPSTAGIWRDCVSRLVPSTITNGEFEQSLSVSDYVYNTGILKTINMNAEYQGPVETTVAATVDAVSSISGKFGEFEGPGRSWTFSDLVVRIPSFDGETRVNTALVVHQLGIFENENSTAFTNDFKRTLQVDLVVQSPRTGNKQIRVVTTFPFSAEEPSGCFTQGEIALYGDDDSLLILNADTGDADTVRFILSETGSVTNTIIPWNNELAQLHLNPSQVGLKFQYPPSPEDASSFGCGLSG